jgi:hypothetical protein
MRFGTSCYLHRFWDLANGWSSKLSAWVRTMTVEIMRHIANRVWWKQALALLTCSNAESSPRITLLESKFRYFRVISTENCLHEVLKLSCFIDKSVKRNSRLLDGPALPSTLQGVTAIRALTFGITINCRGKTKRPLYITFLSNFTKPVLSCLELQDMRFPLICKKSLKLTVTFFKVEKNLKLTVNFNVKRPAIFPRSWIHSCPLSSSQVLSWAWLMSTESF